MGILPPPASDAGEQISGLSDGARVIATGQKENDLHLQGLEAACLHVALHEVENGRARTCRFRGAVSDEACAPKVVAAFRHALRVEASGRRGDDLLLMTREIGGCLLEEAFGLIAEPVRLRGSAGAVFLLSLAFRTGYLLRDISPGSPGVTGEIPENDGSPPCRNRSLP